MVDAYSNLKVTETSLESVVQFFLLLVFILASILLPRTSGLGLVKDDRPYTKIFLGLSLLTTYANIIVTTIYAMDIKKQGQLGLLDKVFHGIAATFQMLAHLFQMVPCALLALPATDFPASDGSGDPSLTPSEAALLLTLPIITKWISIAIFRCWITKNTNGLLKTLLGIKFANLRAFFLHILSNTWVTIPRRSIADMEQVHRGKEIRWSLALAGMNILGTWAVGASFMEGWSPRLLPGNTTIQEFWLVASLLALASHLVGCSFLALHYGCCHRWRTLYTWQRKNGYEGVHEEILDQVSPRWYVNLPWFTGCWGG